MAAEGMEEALRSEQLELSLEPESLNAGSREERASFGRLSIIANGCTMTEGVALDSNELQSGPYVSGYHLAEWFVRNWWRLAYEPILTDYPDDTPMGWDFAHWMSTIGEGYVWPNIQLVSDGFQVLVGSFRSEDPYAKAFRYVGAGKSELIGLECLQIAARKLIHDVLHMLDEANTGNTELHRLWPSLLEDIDRPDVSVKRRIEAMLGFDPEEADPTELRKRVDDVKKLGCDAVAELAADANTRGGHVFAASDIKRVEREVGFDGRIEDAIDLPPSSPIPAWGACEAWQLGVATAHAVRRRAGLNGQPVETPMLASMAGTSPSVINERDRTTQAISFAMDSGSGSCRIAMRSRWETGRRFDLARLIADRLFDNDIGDPLLPATQSYTYRQKAQRAFAAEMLAPIEAVDDFLDDDRSEDRYNDAAEHFNVSQMVISSLLRNNHRL